MTSTSRELQDLHQVYDKAFYADQVAGSVRSAAAVVPRILEIFPKINSVVDVGCGAGTWLHQFGLHGVQRVRGLDGGDPTEEYLHIRRDEILRRDLSMPFDIDEKFDLAMSLEVAEHVAPEFAANFVDNLVRLSDLVVFGAAIPGQGGTNHLNEHWPGFWAALFLEQDYVCFDVLRKDIWYDERIEWWYRQNMMIFAKSSRADLVATLISKRARGGALLDIVHPRCFEVYRSDQELSRVASPPLPIADSLKATSEVIELRAKLQAIEQSAGWKAILTLRRLVTPYSGLRALARRAARAVLWIFRLAPMSKRP